MEAEHPGLQSRRKQYSVCSQFDYNVVNKGMLGGYEKKFLHGEGVVPADLVYVNGLRIGYSIVLILE